MIKKFIFVLILACLLFAPQVDGKESKIDGPNLADDRKVVYGDDDREDYFEWVETHGEDDIFAKIARESIVSLMYSWNLGSPNSDGIYNPSYNSEDLGTAYNLCEGQRYMEQITASECSGTLVDSTHIVTAGHCMNQRRCDTKKIVFNYYITGYDSMGKPKYQTIRESDVYSCVGFTSVLEEGSDGMQDWAYVTLDREVPASSGHVPVTMESNPIARTVGERIVMIGFPSGLPMKIEANGRVISSGSGVLDYFEATSDAFGGNSGSGVFNSDGSKMIGILVRGITDYVSTPHGCNIVNEVNDTGVFDAEDINYAFHAFHECAQTTDCETSEICHRGKCVDPECVSDSDCDGGICQNNFCVKGITTKYFQMTGDCSATDSCVSSGNYPSIYESDEKCEITVLRDAYITSSDEWVVERCCDHVEINEVDVRSRDAVPSSLRVGDTIRWTSDGSVEYSGWQICFQQDPDTTYHPTGEYTDTTGIPTVPSYDGTQPQGTTERSDTTGAPVCETIPNWNAGFGACNTYAVDGLNHNYCHGDMYDGKYAYEVCAECGACVGSTSETFVECPGFSFAENSHCDCSGDCLQHADTWCGCAEAQACCEHITLDEVCEDIPNWNAGFGTCDTYAQLYTAAGGNTSNHDWCYSDFADGRYAYEVCAECGGCVAANSTQPGGGTNTMGATACVPDAEELSQLWWGEQNCQRMQDVWNVCTNENDVNHWDVMTRCPATCANARGEPCPGSSSVTSTQAPTNPSYNCPEHFDWATDTWTHECGCATATDGCRTCQDLLYCAVCYDGYTLVGEGLCQLDDNIDLLESVELNLAANCLYLTFNGEFLNNPTNHFAWTIYDLVDCDNPVYIASVGVLNGRGYSDFLNGNTFCVPVTNWLNEWDLNSELSIDVTYNNAAYEPIMTSNERFCPADGTCCSECTPYTAEQCRAAAESLGLEVGGNGWEFEGDYYQKGCYAYSLGEHAGKAFYGSNGTYAEISDPNTISDDRYRPLGWDCSVSTTEPSTSPTEPSTSPTESPEKVTTTAEIELILESGSTGIGRSLMAVIVILLVLSW